MRRMRWCLSNFSTVAARSRCALAGVGARSHRSRTHVAATSVGDLQHLRIVPPQLMMHAVAQPNAFLLQFLGKARPRPQLDQPRVGNMHAAEQAPVGANAIAHHVGVATVILRTGDTEPVAQAVELLRIDRVHNKSPIDQGIDNRAVRHLDPHRDGVCRSAHRQQPVAKVRQTLAAMRKLPLSRQCGPGDRQGTPDVAPSPSRCLQTTQSSPRSWQFSPLNTSRHDAYRPCTGAQGATSYWASIVTNPPGHMSTSGAEGTGMWWCSRRAGLRIPLIVISQSART